MSRKILLSLSLSLSLVILCLANTAKADLAWGTTVPEGSFTTAEFTVQQTVAPLLKSTVSALVSNNYEDIEYVKFTNGDAYTASNIHLGGNKVTFSDSGEVSFDPSSSTNTTVAKGGTVYFTGDFSDVFATESANFFSLVGYGTVTIGYASNNDDSAPTPEPATMLIIGLGVAGLGLARRRMSK